MAWLRTRKFSIRPKIASSIAALGAIIAITTNWSGSPTPAAAVVPTIVTVEWHDGNADQIDVLPILHAHSMHATFLVNTGPILAGNPNKLTGAQLQTIFSDGNEIAGHTLDHVNVQPLSITDARY
jgi:Polysaccharide deacetylase